MDDFRFADFEEVEKPLTDILEATLNKAVVDTKSIPYTAVQVHRRAQLQEITCDFKTKKTAIHEAGHAVCVWFWGSKPMYLKSTIIPTTTEYFSARGLTSYKRQAAPETLEELFEELGICLAGYIAESMFFPDNKLSSKHTHYYMPGNDMHAALHIAFCMAKLKACDIKCKASGNHEILETVSTYLQKGYKAASYLLKTKERMMLKIALELLNKSTLETKEFITLLGPSRTRPFSLYDQFCGFSIVLRSREKKEAQNMEAKLFARYRETQDRDKKKRKAKPLQVSVKKKSKPLPVS